MASSIDIYQHYPLHLNPTTKAITLPSSSSQSSSQTASINEELEALNQLHRAILNLDPPNTPPPPLPVNPKRSAQVSKLRDTANAAYRKSNYVEAAKLYTLAIEMAMGRPGWEPVTMARDELAGLFANRAQAHMAQQSWPDGLQDAKASIDSKPVANVKAWWRGGKCLAEMGRWEEAKSMLEKGLEIEGKNTDGGKDLVTLLADVEQRLQSSS